MIRTLACLVDGHHWQPISNLPLAGKVRAYCGRCGRVSFVRLR